MNTLVFIRHGETGMAGAFCGHSDPVLNPAGESQVRLLAEEVAMLGIERIYSSDLRRTAQTAVAIAQRIGVNVNYLPALREIHFGLWEGLHWQEIEDRYSDEAGRWLREFPARSAPGGEAYADFTARVDNIIATLFERSAGRTTAVVTHRGVMRCALTRFCSFPEDEAWTKTAPYCAMVTVPVRMRDCEVLFAEAGRGRGTRTSATVASAKTQGRETKSSR
jgi:alpha-ribazole phosphatase/probable phosphoglycerate mutase